MLIYYATAIQLIVSRLLNSQCVCNSDYTIHSIGRVVRIPRHRRWEEQKSANHLKTVTLIEEIVDRTSLECEGRRLGTSIAVLCSAMRAVPFAARPTLSGS
jgi:hypothetical protein